MASDMAGNKFVVAQVEVESKELDDAIAEGCARLGIAKAEAEIEILDEGSKGSKGSKGILGIGAKEAVEARNARVIVKKIGDSTGSIKDIVLALIEPLDERADVDLTVGDDGKWHGDVHTEELGLVLGRRGRTIDAIQTLASALASKKTGARINIVLDASGFREKRREALVEMAKSMAEEAVETNGPVHLDPMSSFDRKIVHSALASNDAVDTSSEDKGERRHVVISPAGTASASRSGDGRSRRSSRGGAGRRSGGGGGARRGGLGRGGTRRGGSRGDSRSLGPASEGRTEPTESSAGADAPAE